MKHKYQCHEKWRDNNNINITIYFLSWLCFCTRHAIVFSFFSYLQLLLIRIHKVVLFYCCRKCFKTFVYIQTQHTSNATHVISSKSLVYISITKSFYFFYTGFALTPLDGATWSRRALLVLCQNTNLYGEKKKKTIPSHIEWEVERERERERKRENYVLAWKSMSFSPRSCLLQRIFLDHNRHAR